MKEQRFYELCSDVAEAIEQAVSGLIGKPEAGEVLYIGADGTPTEKIDEVAENVALSVLETDGRSMRIVSEELGEKVIGKDPEFAFIIDPIDGTFNAVNNIPFFQKIFSKFNIKYHVICDSDSSEIKENDEVIVPSFSFISTANSILFVRGTPKFSDIEEKTFGLDPEKITPQISDKTKIIMPMDYGGLSCQINELQEIAKEKDFPGDECSPPDFVDERWKHCFKSNLLSLAFPILIFILSIVTLFVILPLLLLLLVAILKILKLWIDALYTSLLSLAGASMTNVQNRELMEKKKKKNVSGLEGGSSISSIIKQEVKSAGFQYRGATFTGPMRGEFKAKEDRE